MAIITESAKNDWRDKPSPRDGGIRIKPLARGVPGAPDNFEFNLYRFLKGYATPRHRHNFEQMRFGISGAITYDPGKPVSPGSLVYFPEGAFYGPQDNPVESDILLLQYGGASGQGYISQEQIIQARADMSKTGSFKDGIYTWYDATGKKHNKDGVEAIYEHVFGREVEYVNPRITESVKIDTLAYHWVSAGAGLEEKPLATFTERRVSASMVRAIGTATLSLPADRRQLLFNFKGRFSVDGRSCGEQTSVYSDRGEALTLKLEPGWEALCVTLP